MANSTVSRTTVSISVSESEPGIHSQYARAPKPARFTETFLPSPPACAVPVRLEFNAESLIVSSAPPIHAVSCGPDRGDTLKASKAGKPQQTSVPEEKGHSVRDTSKPLRSILLRKDRHSASAQIEQFKARWAHPYRRPKHVTFGRTVAQEALDSYTAAESVGPPVDKRHKRVRGNRGGSHRKPLAKHTVKQHDGSGALSAPDKNIITSLSTTPERVNKSAGNIFSEAVNPEVETLCEDIDMDGEPLDDDLKTMFAQWSLEEKTPRVFSEVIDEERFGAEIEDQFSYVMIEVCEEPFRHGQTMWGAGMGLW